MPLIDTDSPEFKQWLASNVGPNRAAQNGLGGSSGGGTEDWGKGNGSIKDLTHNIDQWNPYYNPNGSYQWANPNYANAVPNSNIPGAPKAPNTTYQNTAANLQAFSDLLPYLQGSINSQTLPTALSNLQASQVTSPAYADLMTQLYAQYGPALNAIGSGINAQNMGALVGAQTGLLSGPGQDLLNQGYNASQIFDAPYYQARQQTGQALGSLLNSIDLSGNLSGSETNQIAQGLARQGVQTGTLNAPNQAGNVANAMQYGNAAYQRKQAAQSAMSSAINAAAGYLPTSKSGINVFDTATGMAANNPTNSGNNLFTGINTNFGQNIGQDFLNQITGTGNTAMTNSNQFQINQKNIDANKKDWSDFLEQNSQSFSNFAGGAAKMAGCWIAREVYGNDNPDWVAFRNYLFTEAPSSLFNLYLTKGPQIAKAIRNNIGAKLAIKQLMNQLI